MEKSGIRLFSINVYIKKNSDIVKSVIANGYTMYYTNMMNAYTNIAVLCIKGKIK